LAGADDALRQRIGDLVVTRTKHGGQLPTAAEVRRKLGAGLDPAAPNVTVADLVGDWFASKRSAKMSTLRGYRQHLDHYVIPFLGQIPTDRLRAEHVAAMFDTIETWNTEIVAARTDNRTPKLDGDQRQRTKLVGVATQRRIFATLRNALNYAVRKRRLIDFNPCDGVEMPAEERDAALTWSPAQVAGFLAAAEHDPMYLMFRLVLLRGFRRGELVGLRVADFNPETKTIAVTRPVLQLGGRIVEDTPKSRAGRRVVSLDAETVRLMTAHLTSRKRARLIAGQAWQDNDLIFCQDDGSVISPDRVTNRFKAIARDAGLPVIRLHDGRHTAASLGLEAGVDIKLVSEQLGHSTTRITQDLYTHVRRELHDDAAERIVSLLPERRKDETGS
jgi:integrase